MSSMRERMDLRVPEVGIVASGIVCLRNKNRAITKQGKPYFKLELSNRTGTISAAIWNEGMPTWEALEVGAPLYVEGTVKAGWNDGPPELVVTDVRPLSRPHDVELELNPLCPIPNFELRQRFTHILEHLKLPGRELVQIVLEHVGEENWWTAPAAKTMHHACIGGLAWHSIEVAELALAIARGTPAAPSINWDALLVGALLHDIGKVQEYCWRGVPIDLSATGRLTYHTCSGGILTMSAVDRFRSRIARAGVTELDVAHLCHVQISHHGTKEFGSPVEPCTPEAVIIHHADNVSAKLRMMLDDIQASPCDADGWVRPAGWGRRPILSLQNAPQQLLREIREEPTDGDATGAVVDPMASRPSKILLRVIPESHHIIHEEGI